MAYSIETVKKGDITNVIVKINGAKVAETNVAADEEKAKKYVEKYFLKDLKKAKKWDIKLPDDKPEPQHLTVIDGVKVYWYEANGKPRYRPISSGDEAYDSTGTRIYGYDKNDGSVLYVEPTVTKKVIPKPLEIVDGVKVYYYLLDKTPVFKPMKDYLKKGVKGYTFNGDELAGYDEYGNIVYVKEV